ncbi:hypothetical protein OAR82_03480, partial [Candidatus Pelagibacter sp.]|nr:hypothetical protein [Candidatus Pelagibacter sp.]
TPHPLNKYFYKIGGVNFQNIKKCWIGLFCFIDNKNAEQIYIEENVCISFKVTIVSHFDPKYAIKNHPIKNKKNKIIIKKNVFIGSNTTILPNVTLKKGTFVMAGSVVCRNSNEYDIIQGNPAKKIGSLLRFKKYKKQKEFFN